MTTITISGLPGSGKTTVARILEKETGLEYVYSGQIFRSLAQKYHMTLEAFGQYAETHEKIDKELDDFQVSVLKKGDVIVEGRLAGWLAYQHNIAALKVMLEADLSTRTSRIVNREPGDLKHRKQEIQKREQSEARRYKKYYGIDISDLSIYDLVIDTSDKSPNTIASLILKNLKESS